MAAMVGAEGLRGAAASAGPDGPRERAARSMLFADIVSSTETLERIGDSEWRQIHSSHKRAVEAGVHLNGGTIVSFSGDGFLAVFEEPSSAILAAAQVRSSLSALGLTIRTGFHHGEVDLVGEDVTGRHVHVAARVMALAGPGEILVTDTVLERVPAAVVACENRGLHELRGLSGKWQLWSLDPSLLPLEPPLAQPRFGRLPLTPWASADPGRLVGRSAELEQLQSAWQTACSAGVRAVVVGGEPGMGKTRLVSELARRVHESGATVLWGRCDEGLAVPFQPLVEQASYLIEHLPRGVAREILGEDAAELSRLVPRIASLVPGATPLQASDPHTEQFRLFTAIEGVLARLSRRSPVLLVAEDLHWATPSTLKLLRHLVTRASTCPVMLVATYRNVAPDRTDDLEAWLAAVGAVATTTRLELRGLSVAALAELVPEPAAGSAGESPADWAALPELIHGRTGGNPLFALHVTTELSETLQTTGRLVDPGQLIPKAAVDAISRRFVRLPVDTRRLLQEAAVIGRTFDLTLLAPLAEVDKEAAGDLLEPALAAQLVREHATEPFEYEFAHSLVVDAILQTWRPGRLRQAHLRVARLLESGHSDALPDQKVLGELARHYVAARVEPERELRYTRAAAEASMQALAYGDAADQWTQALDAADRAGAKTEDLTSIRIDLVTAAAAAGRPGWREGLESAWKAAIAMGDPEVLARAALSVTRGNWSSTGRVDASRIAVLEAALSARPVRDGIYASLLAQLATELTWAPAEQERRTALAAEALELSGQVGSLGGRLNLIGQSGSAVQHPDNVAWMTEWFDRTEADLDRLTDPVLVLQVAWTGVSFAGIGADRAKYDRYRRKIDSVMAQRLPPRGVFLARWIGLGFLFLEGRFDEVLAGAEQLIELSTSIGVDDGETVYAFYYLLIGHLRGEAAELAPLLRAYAEDFGQGMPGLAAAVAMLEAHSGNLPEALRVLDRLAADDFSDLRRDQATILWLTFAADAARRCGALRHCEQLYRILLPYADQLSFNGGYAMGAVRHWLGVLAGALGRFDDAIGHFTGAIDKEISFDMAFWVTASRAESAMLRLRDGDGSAREELFRLRAEASEQRNQLVVTDIDAALADSSRRIAAPGADPVP